MNDDYTKAIIQAKTIFRRVAERAGVEWTKDDEEAVEEFVHCIMAATDYQASELVNSYNH
jgi:hypothetical protein